jgi:phosphoserine phosphatase RsbU/P
MQLASREWMEIQEISVLLIEDAAGDAAAIIKALCFGETLYSFKVHRKSSLEDGLNYLKDNKVDAVLLDLDLPDANALMALNRVHSLFPSVPIVIISGYSDMSRVHAALHQGAQEFLVKGECCGATIRQSIYQAITRKRIELSYQRGDKI